MVIIKTMDALHKRMCASSVILGITAIAFSFVNLFLTTILAVEGILIACVSGCNSKKLVMTGAFLNILGLALAIMLYLL